MYKNTVALRTQTSDRKYIYILIGIVVLLSILFIWWINRLGPGISPDSTTYVKAAANMQAGKGFTLDGHPVIFYPPLYPLLLSVFGLLLNNIITGARLLSAILYGINIGLVALLVYFSTGRKYLPAIIAMLLFISTGSLMTLHAMAWTEPLFITLSLLSLLFLSLYVENSKFYHLVISALALAFACLTRYIGIAFIPVGIAVLLWADRKRMIKKRILDLGTWSVLASVPLGIFILKNVLVAKSATGRLIVSHPIGIQDFSYRVFLHALNFIEPINFPFHLRPFLLLIIFVAVLIRLVYLFRHNSAEINWSSFEVALTLSGILFSALYFLFLYLTISFLDASTPVDDRLLVPVFVIAIVCIFSAAWSLLTSLHQTRLWPWFLFVLILFVIAKTPDAIQTVQDIQQNGSGYTSGQWRESPTIAYLNSLPTDTVIYSNGNDVIDFTTKINAEGIPVRWNPTTTEPNQNFNNDVRVMCTTILNQDGLFVYFNRNYWKTFLPTPSEILQICPLVVYKAFSDGTVFGK